MKLIIAYLPPAHIEPIITALVGIHVHGITISKAQGFGQEHDLRAKDDYEYSASEIRKVSRLEVACQDEEVERILDALFKTSKMLAYPSPKTSGKVLVLDIVDALRMKSGERGTAAIGHSINLI